MRRHHRILARRGCAVRNLSLIRPVRDLPARVRFCRSLSQCPHRGGRGPSRCRGDRSVSPNRVDCGRDSRGQCVPFPVHIRLRGPRYRGVESRVAARWDAGPGGRGWIPRTPSISRGSTSSDRTVQLSHSRRLAHRLYRGMRLLASPEPFTTDNLPRGGRGPRMPTKRRATHSRGFLHRPCRAGYRCRQSGAASPMAGGRLRLRRGIRLCGVLCISQRVAAHGRDRARDWVDSRARGGGPEDDAAPRIRPLSDEPTPSLDPTGEFVRTSRIRIPPRWPLYRRWRRRP